MSGIQQVLEAVFHLRQKLFDVKALKNRTVRVELFAHGLIELAVAAQILVSEVEQRNVGLDQALVELFLLAQRLLPPLCD